MPYINKPGNGITGDTRSPLQTIHKYIPNINKPESTTWAAQGRPYRPSKIFPGYVSIRLFKMRSKNLRFVKKFCCLSVASSKFLESQIFCFFQCVRVRGRGLGKDRANQDALLPSPIYREKGIYREECK